MNQTQVKHARERALAIYNKRKSALEAKYTDKGHKLTADEKLDALKKGRFLVRKKRSAGDYYLESYVAFKDERERAFDQKKYDADHTILKTTYDNLIDELILGDQQVALSLLRSFDV